MPFRDSSIASSPLASLPEILKLEPERESWCAGYAPSKGRRCHVSTNAHGRRSAAMLLNEGTNDLRAGRSIDALLEDLAPYVLCTRFHQGQAAGLISRWKRRVRTYLDSQVALTPSPRPMRMSSRIVYSETAEANAERIALLEQRLLEAMEKLVRLEAAQQHLPSAANSPNHSSDENTSAAVSSSSAGSAINTHTSPADIIEPTVRRETAESPNQSDIPAPQSAQVQFSGETSNASAVSRQPTIPPLVGRAFSSPEHEDDQYITPRANRREVEGECGICLCNLNASQQHVNVDADADADTDEQEESDGDGDDRDNESDEEDEDDYQDEDLVWCKAHCGVNFHKGCIDQWLETAHAPTCPMCRGDWRY
ncbi:hypothetical protein N7475_004922 [Penicillium sp. IBT 31633x]|nr:hypothetical protein N7475_004922 [Penicillium sp. IBT 31633x]